MAAPPNNLYGVLDITPNVYRQEIEDAVARMWYLARTEDEQRQIAEAFMILDNTTSRRRHDLDLLGRTQDHLYTGERPRSRQWFSSLTLAPRAKSWKAGPRPEKRKEIIKRIREEILPYMSGPNSSSEPARQRSATPPPLILGDLDLGDAARPRSTVGIDGFEGPATAGVLGSEGLRMADAFRQRMGRDLPNLEPLPSAGVNFAASPAVSQGLRSAPDPLRSPSNRARDLSGAGPNSGKMDKALAIMARLEEHLAAQPSAPLPGPTPRKDTRPTSLTDFDRNTPVSHRRDIPPVSANERKPPPRTTGSRSRDEIIAAARQRAIGKGRHGTPRTPSPSSTLADPAAYDYSGRGDLGTGYDGWHYDPSSRMEPVDYRPGVDPSQGEAYPQDVADYEELDNNPFVQPRRPMNSAARYPGPATPAVTRSERPAAADRKQGWRQPTSPSIAVQSPALSPRSRQNPPSGPLQPGRTLNRSESPNFISSPLPDFTCRNCRRRPRRGNGTGGLLPYCSVACEQAARGSGSHVDTSLKRETTPPQYPRDRIEFYHPGQPYYALANSSSYRVEYGNESYATAEHAYQAQKFVQRPIYMEHVGGQRTAEDARKTAHHYDHKARNNKGRTEWLYVRDYIMKDILRAKVDQHPPVRDQLLGTGNFALVYASPDNWWGMGSGGRGQNVLGKLLMELRDELRGGSVV